MSFIRHSIWRNRNKLKMAGWGMLASVAICCVLTVQLCATEGQSSAPPLPQQLLDEPAPIFTPGTDLGLPSASLETLKALANSTPGNTVIIMEPATLGMAPASQLFHPASSNVPIDGTTAMEYDYSQMSPNASALLGTEHAQPGVTCDGDCSQTRSTPRSNYFGVDPDSVCDEWSGFCNCDQKMFTRRGEACDDGSCGKKRKRWARRASECSGL